MTKKVTTEEMLAFFWVEGDILSKELVNIDLHDDSLIEVSVMLRNEEDGVPVSVQILRGFDTVQEFIDEFEISEAEEVYDIGLVRMMELYKAGKAELSVVDVVI